MSLALQSHDSLPAASSAGDAALRDLSKIALPTTFALLVANIVFLAASTVQGYWPVYHAGQPLFSAFVNVCSHSPGRLFAIDGKMRLENTSLIQRIFSRGR